MTLTIVHAPIASAGDAANICQGGTYIFSGATASNQASLQWTTTGLGGFTNTTTLNPTYVPLADETGLVTFTLTANPTDPCAAPAISTKTLTIQAKPTADAGSEATICQGSNHTISGATATNGSINWTTSNGSGFFTGNGTLTPTYHPSVNDFASNSVTLTLNVTGIGLCSTPATSDMTLHLVSAPTADAGAPTATMCEEGSYTVSSASTTHNFNRLWTHNGSGNLTATTTLTPTYTAAVGETGPVTLTLTSYANPGCSTDATDQVVITIQPKPTADAGIDATICEGATHTLTGAVTNNASYSWSSNGTGSWAASNTLSPTYTPSAADVSAVSVIITLKAFAISPCGVDATNTMILTLVAKPLVNAGNDATICATGGYVLSTSSASNHAGILWTTSGDGTFSSDGAIHPTYTPGPNDKINGSVILTLTGQPNTFCTLPVSDTMTLTINAVPTADAGPATATICAGSYTLSGTSATHYTTLLWTSSGTAGTLANATSLTPTYSPSATDITAGTVTLTLTVKGNSPCATPATDATDHIDLTITPRATVNAGPNTTICQDGSYTVISGNATSSNASSLKWTHNGNGSISNETGLTPTYTSSPLDVVSGTVTLTLTAKSAAPCDSPANDATSQMTISVIPLPVVDAGPSTSICSGSFTASGATASHYASLLWTTSSSTGSFTVANILNATYIPSPEDILAGSVTLTLHAIPNDPPCSGSEVTDVMTLSFLPATTVSAGPDAPICSGASYVLAGSATTNSSLLHWSGGSGTFSDAGILHPTYTPSAADRSAGTVTLTLAATGITPCNDVVTSSMILTIAPLATAYAGGAATICEGSTYSLADALATHSSALSWTSSGTGTFSGGAIIQNPIYTPSAADKTAGTVTLTLKATGIGTCSAVASSSMVLTIAHPATPNAGIDASICAGSNFVVPAATAPNSASVYWVSSSGGTFLNGTTLTPTYQPSAGDISTGSVTLTLHAVSIAPCSGEVTDALILTISPAATANAGGDEPICATETYTLSGEATLYSSVSWETSGSGTFSNNTILNPIYTPGTNDKNAGSVILTLHVTGIAPCSSVVSNSMTLTIAPVPIVNAGPDATACLSTFQVTGATASHQNVISWTTSSSSGSFTSGSNTLSPIYTPSAADINAGSVVLTIYSTSISPCVGTVSDEMTLSFLKVPTANAGVGASVCQGSSYQLINTGATNYGTLLWATTGDGTFSGGTTLTPIYTPGTADISTGTVTLTLRSNGLAPCNDFVTDAMDLTIAPSSVVDAGPADAICAGDDYIFSGVTASNYSALHWFTSGTGTFSDFTITNPTYTPSVADKTAGSVTLTLVAYNNSPCSGNNSDAMLLTINTDVTVNAGPDDVVCYPASYTISGSSASNATAGYVWSTPNGTGTFINTTSLHPTYFPSATDKGQTITFELVGTSGSPCNGSDNDIMTLNVQDIPATAGSITGTATVCQGVSSVAYSVGAVTGATGYNWTLPSGATIASGTNTNSITVNFSNSALTGVVKVSGTNSCGSGVSSADYAVTVNPIPIVTTANTATICSGTSPNISLTASVASTFAWTIGTNTGITGMLVGSGSTINQTLTNTSNSTPNTVEYIVTPTSTTGSCVGAAYKITVTVNPTPALTSTLAPTSVCSNTVFSYTPAGTPSGVTFSWSRAAVTGISNSAATGTGNVNETLINTTTSSVDVTYVYTASANGCSGASTYNVVVTVKPTPTLSGSLTPSAICDNTVFAYTASSATIGTTFAWSRAVVAGISNSTASASGNISETLDNTTSAPVNVTYVYTLSANSCSNVQNVVITVNPTPVLTSSLTAPAICSNSSFSYTPLSSTSGATYSWARAAIATINGNASGTGSGNVSETLISTSSAPVSVT